MFLNLVLVIELLLVFLMASFDSPLLLGFARIDEVMDDAVVPAEYIKRMKGFDRHIASFVGAKVVVGKHASVVGLDCEYPVGESCNHFLEEAY